MRILTKPFYVYVIDGEDDEYKATVYVQDLKYASRNRIILDSESRTFDNIYDAIAWGEKTVEANSR